MSLAEASEDLEFNPFYQAIQVGGYSSMVLIEGSERERGSEGERERGRGRQREWEME